MVPDPTESLQARAEAHADRVAAIPGFLKRYKTTRAKLIEQYFADEPKRLALAEQQRIWREEAAQREAEIAALPQVEREVIKAREGLMYAEMGDTFDSGAVSRIREARAALAAAERAACMAEAA